MDCLVIESLLVGFHFGSLSATERALAEEHLPRCPRCLEAFLKIKRHIECPPTPGPSPQMRQRLREEIATTFPVHDWKKSAKPWRNALPGMPALLAAGILVTSLVIALATHLPRATSPAAARLSSTVIFDSAVAGSNLNYF